MTVLEHFKKQPINNNVILKLRRKKSAKFSAQFKETPLEKLLKIGWSLPPQKLLELLKIRGQQMKLTWNWNDMGAAAHSKAFTVAKVMSADILQDIHNALVKARTEGWDLKKFKADLLPTLESKGWTKRIVKSPEGKTQSVNIGSRLTTIYNTNNAMDYSRGRFEEMSLTTDSRPIWQYRQVQRLTKRPAHARFHLKTFPADDPIWKRIWAPSDYNCLCEIVPLRKTELDILSKKEGEPLKVEKGTKYLKYIAQNQEQFKLSPLKEWAPDVTKYVTGIRNALEKLLLEVPKTQIAKPIEDYKPWLKSDYGIARKKWFKEAERLESMALNPMEYKKLTKQELKKADALDAHSDYLGSGFIDINTSLRKNRPNKQAKLMKEYLFDSKLPQNTILYRGSGDVNFGKLLRKNAVKEGSFYNEKAFISTSLSKSEAENFLEDGVMLKILAPKGTNFTFGTKSEKELILLPQNFKITKIEKILIQKIGEKEYFNFVVTLIPL